jgi:hypothetical protein
MTDETKKWLVYLGIWAAALAMTWGWTKMQMGNLAYMQFITKTNQEAVARQQQLEANELQLKEQRGECCDCSLIPPPAEPEEEGPEG